MTEAAAAALHRALCEVYPHAERVEADALADQLESYGYRVTEYLLPASKNPRSV